MSSLSSKIAWNTLVQMLGKGASTFLGLIIVIILTRYLGVAGYGTFTFVTVVVTLFGSFADWGLTLITIREAAKNDPEADIIIGNILVIRLILAFLAALASIIAVHFLNQSTQIQSLTALASLLLIALSVKSSFQIIFNVKLQMQFWALSEFVANLVTLLLLIFVVAHGGGLAEVIVTYLIGDLISAIVAAILGHHLLPLKFSLLNKNTKFLLIEALPMGAILVIFTIYNRMDTIILASFKGQSAVGIYGAAYRVLEVLVLGAAYFANSVLPLISNLAHTDIDRLRIVYRKSFVILLLLGVSVALTCFILAPLGIAIIAGPKFSDSVNVLRILSLVIVVAYFNHLNGYTLMALGKQWYSLGIAGVALIVNVILNLIFIPRFSYNAAAFNTFLTELLITTLTLTILHKHGDLTPHLSDIPATIKELIEKRGHIF